jgi:AAHS family 4-hydroxybenzoate transporter-like MFS transporter
MQTLNELPLPVHDSNGGRASWGNTIDIGELIDASRCTGLQKLAIALAACSIIFDGFDGQLIGFAIPAILKDWGVTRTAFAPVVASGLIGMAIGSSCAGIFADKFGRRWAVIFSMLLLGVSACCTGLATDITNLVLLRLLAGLGIGGALPSSTTVTAEFTPLKWRTFAITSTIVLYPFGGMLAGFFASHVLPLYGWRQLFLIGGLFPIGLAVLLFFLLPESPRFLVRSKHRWAELGAVLHRMGLNARADAIYADSAEAGREAGTGVGFRSLFKQGRAHDTLAIWGALFMCLLASYSAFSWLPTMLTSIGLQASLAGGSLTAYNFGGVFGAIVCALLITRLGSKWPLLVCCVGAAFSAFGMQFIDVTKNPDWLVIGFGIQGLFVNAVQSTMYAVCAHIYPTCVRATGTAAALSFGRLGAIFSAFAGAAVISIGGANAYLGMLGIAMLLVLIALTVLKKHIPQRTMSAN